METIVKKIVYGQTTYLCNVSIKEEEKITLLVEQVSIDVPKLKNGK